MQKQWQAAEAERVAVARLDLLTGAVGSDDDRATLPEAELSAEEDAQVEAATLASVVPVAADTFAAEQHLLDRMAELAEQARYQPDARVRALVDWIREHQCPDLPPLGNTPPPNTPPPRWTETRVILFTEYDDTKRYLRQQLEAAIAGTDRADARIAVYHGPTPPEEREAIKRAFNTAPAQQPLRILIATDAAREGLNLQAYCHHLFHFDVPWNPSRMEQRNGRIDRKLQPRPVVYCYYFYYAQRQEDCILATLVRKTETIQRQLGSLSQVVEGRLAELLRGGIRHADIARLAGELEQIDLSAPLKATVSEELDAARDRQQSLREQLDRLRDRLARSQQWLNFREAPFRAALAAALQLQGAGGLQTLPEPSADGLPRFTLPTDILRRDPTWTVTLDTLREPRSREQKWWEWRQQALLRPVVFQAPASLDETVVQLHLEHRLVQRLLGRFRAQGFVHHDLARVCLTNSRDPIPRVLLLGRLCLYGPGAARLHEQLLAITARWTDPAQGKRPLVLYAREAESKTLDLLEEALAQTGPLNPTATIEEHLLTSVARDVQELLPLLEQRGQVLAQEARQQLQQRGEREAKAMREILEEQRQRLAATAAKYENPQLTLAFNDDEKRQLDADRRHWSKRLAALATELEREPARIREVYEVRASRLEPVGLVYLWPVTG